MDNPQFFADPDKCIRCSACISDCVVNVLSQDPKSGVPVMSPKNEMHCIGCQHCLAICPAGAISVCGVEPERCIKPGKIPDPEQMENLIHQRRSIRQFRDLPVEPEILRHLMDSLKWSPTGCNDHRLHFRLVTVPEEMTVFRQEAGKMLNFLIRSGIMKLVYPQYTRYLDRILAGEDVIFRNAPCMLTVSSPKNAPCGEADPWIALTQFDLLAQSFGLGTCWCGFAYYGFRYYPPLRKLLALPKGYRPGAVMLFGYPLVRYARVPQPPPVLE